MPRRAYLLAVLFALALVLLPFLFWYDTWFGRKLSDRQIEAYLRDRARPRHTQHALVQIGERLGRHDPSVRRWYPQIVELAASPAPELRQTAAWIMGQDTREASFQKALLRLVRDPAALVRRNAALSLAAFGDPAGRGELRAMLRSYEVAAPAAGPIHYRLKEGEYVNPGTLIARIGGTDVRSPVPGSLTGPLQPEGAQVTAGQPLASIAPDENHAWEALRALYLIGGEEDAAEVARYARGVAGMRPALQRQAALTLQQIRSRTNP